MVVPKPSAGLALCVGTLSPNQNPPLPVCPATSRYEKSTVGPVLRSKSAGRL